MTPQPSIPKLDVQRWARFAGVGVSGFFVQVSSLHGLTTLGGVDPTLATALSVELAILTNFVWHERWTWKDRTRAHEGVLRRFLAFNGVAALVSIGGSVLLTWFYTRIFGLPLVPANVLAVVSLSLFNFVAADRLIFPGRASAAGS